MFFWHFAYLRVSLVALHWLLRSASQWRWASWVLAEWSTVFVPQPWLAYCQSLTSVVADADLIILVAGLGEGTVGGVTPIMPQSAGEAGALTVAAVVTSFAFERERTRTTSATAIKQLQYDADLVTTSCP